jgi:hypothetical protein
MNINPFREIIQQVPGQPDPTSGDAEDLRTGRTGRTVFDLREALGTDESDLSPEEN